MAEISEEYAKSSFEDFKMLSAIGALLTFEPATSLFKLNDEMFLLIGFLSILLIISFIGFYGLMKQSIAVFYLNEICKFEAEIRDLIKDQNGEMSSFKVAENWRAFGSKNQRIVAKRFYLLFYIVVSCFPSAVLFVSCCSLKAAIYFFISIAVCIFHFSTAKMIHDPK